MEEGAARRLLGGAGQHSTGGADVGVDESIDGHGNPTTDGWKVFAQAVGISLIAFDYRTLWLNCTA